MRDKESKMSKKEKAIKIGSKVRIVAFTDDGEIDEGTMISNMIGKVGEVIDIEDSVLMHPLVVSVNENGDVYDFCCSYTEVELVESKKVKKPQKKSRVIKETKKLATTIKKAKKPTKSSKRK